VGSAATRQVIMRGVDQLLKSRPLDKISVADVAKTAGVGKGTIYLYFPSKTKLILQTITAGVDEMSRSLADSPMSPEPFERRLSRACSRLGGLLEQKQHLLTVLASTPSHRRPPPSQMGTIGRSWRRRICASCAELLRQGVHEGKIRGDIGPEVLADMLLSILWSRASSLGGLPCPADHYELAVQLFLSGAGTRIGG